MAGFKGAGCLIVYAFACAVCLQDESADERKLNLHITPPIFPLLSCALLYRVSVHRQTQFEKNYAR